MKLFFGGDIVLNKEIDSTIFFPEKIGQDIKDSDLACVNFEGPCVAEEKELVAKRKAGPVLSQNPDNIRCLSDLGINLFCLANNHIMDKGEQGLKETMRLVESSGAAFIGAGRDQEEAYRIFRKDGDVSVSIIAVAERSFGCANDNGCGFAWMMDYRVEAAIKEEKEKSDFVIVICHCGAELFALPIPEVREMYKHFIDLGANVIVGHHPHICQGVEQYKEGAIFYSLGNMAFEGFQYGEGTYFPGAVVTLELTHDSEKIKYDITPIRFTGERIEIISGSDFDKWLKEQSEIMSDEARYLELVNDYCVLQFNETYRIFMQRGCGMYLHSFKSKIGTCLRLFKGNLQEDRLLQLHNFMVETNRWIIERALKQSIK